MADPAVAPVVVQEPGVFESIKTSLSPSNLMRKFNLTPAKLMEIVIYFGVGIIIGYLLKKYGKFLIILILGCVGLLLLHQIGIISITFHADKFQELFGIQPATGPGGNPLALYWQWIKANVALVVSLSIGFLVGLRIGG